MYQKCILTSDVNKTTFQTFITKWFNSELVQILSHRSTTRNKNERKNLNFGQSRQHAQVLQCSTLKKTKLH